ncbi:MAG: hypothetical protein Q9208_001645 [Pyrenodesmia sp. 3 TL-2023]
MAHMLHFAGETHPCYSPTCTFKSPKCYSPCCVNASAKPASSRVLVPLDGNKVQIFAPPMVYKVHNPSIIARSGSKISSLRKITRKIMTLTRAVPRIEVTPPAREERGKGDAVGMVEKGKGAPKGNYNLLHPDSHMPSVVERKQEEGSKKLLSTQLPDQVKSYIKTFPSPLPFKPFTHSHTINFTDYNPQFHLPLQAVAGGWTPLTDSPHPSNSPSQPLHPTSQQTATSTNMAPTTRSQTRSIRRPDTAPPLGPARTTTAPFIHKGRARTTLIRDIRRHRPRDGFAEALARRKLQRQMVRPLREKIVRLEAENEAMRQDWLVGLERGGWPDKHGGEVEWDEVYGPRDSDDAERFHRGAFDGRDRMEAERDAWMKKFKKENKYGRKIYQAMREAEEKVKVLEEAAKSKAMGGKRTEGV